MTTMVFKLRGTPSRRARRGSRLGPSTSTTARLTSAMARSEAGMAATSPRAISQPSFIPES